MLLAKCSSTTASMMMSGALLTTCLSHRNFGSVGSMLRVYKDIKSIVAIPMHVTHSGNHLSPHTSSGGHPAVDAKGASSSVDVFVTYLEFLYPRLLLTLQWCSAQASRVCFSPAGNLRATLGSNSASQSAHLAWRYLHMRTAISGSASAAPCNMMYMCCR